jgi:hypothetical protein
MNSNESFDRTASHMAGEYVSNAEPVAYVYQNFGIGRVAWLTEVPPDGTKLYTHPVKELTDEEINIVAILQDAEIVPVGHEIWKTGEEFNKYKKIVLATAKALRKAQEK